MIASLELYLGEISSSSSSSLKVAPRACTILNKLLLPLLIQGETSRRRDEITLFKLMYGMYVQTNVSEP